MPSRPLSLTIIGWWLVIGALFAVYSILNIESNPIAMKMLQAGGVSMGLYKVNGLVGAVISLICAYGILKGLPWSRVLYVVWGVIGLAMTFILIPAFSMIALSLIFFAIIAFFLFRPTANEWFGTTGLGLQRNG